MEIRVPVMVLGVLSRDTIKLVLAPGQGLADGGVPIEIPIDWVPMDLRVPNKTFTVVLDAGTPVRVERN